jgi:hypothetical protein
MYVGTKDVQENVVVKATVFVLLVTEKKIKVKRLLILVIEIRSVTI